MGQWCDKEYLLGTTRAHSAANAYDSTSDFGFQERFEGKPWEQQAMAAYEDFFRATALKHEPKPYVLPEEAIRDFGKSSPKTTAGDIVSTVKGFATTFKHRSDFFGDEFYKKVSKPLQQFQKSLDAEDIELLRKGQAATSAKARFNKEVEPEIRKILVDIIKHTHEDNLAPLKEKYGLERHQVYEASEYLSWLRDSKWLDQSGLTGEVLSNFGTAQARLNLSWSIFNGFDLMRIASQYSTKPGVLMRGLQDAFTDKGMFTAFNLIDGVPEYHKPTRLIEKLDPFNATNRVQQRLAFYLDLADGGDGLTGMRKNAFIRDPWDITGIENKSKFGVDGAKGAMGLGRFLLSETIWNAENYINALKVLGTAGTKGDKRQLANFAVYNAAKTAMFGPVSVLPAPLWHAIREDVERYGYLDEMEAGLVSSSINFMLEQVGFNAKYSIGEMVQPMSLVLGARYQQITSTFGTMADSAVSSGVDLIKGDLVGSFGNMGLLYFSAGMAAGGLPKMKDPVSKLARDKFPTWLGSNQTFSDVMTSSTAIKILKTGVRAHEEGYNNDRLSRELGKAVLGHRAVKAKE